MKVNIRAKDIELNDALKAFIEEKINSLDCFIQQADNSFENGKSTIEVNFEIERTTAHHHKGEVFRAEGNLFLGGKNLRSEATSEDLRMAITIVKDELQALIRKFKGKRMDTVRKRLREIKNKFF